MSQSVAIEARGLEKSYVEVRALCGVGRAGDAVWALCGVDL
jgi:hypothetical protein